MDMKQEIKRVGEIHTLRVCFGSNHSFTLCKSGRKSMQPTLYEEDYVFVNKAAVHFPI